MRLYHAGAAGDKERPLWEAGVRRVLLAFDGRAPGLPFWSAQRADVFLDSGAYAAFMHGRRVDVGAYCEFLREHGDQLEAYAALDVIGNWRASAENLDEMRRRGLQPVPVFHRGSPLSELERLAREHRYIGLGGMMSHRGQKLHRQTPEHLRPHLDAAFGVLRRHWPVRVHLFGTFTQWVLERYPVYSADSATVALGAALGTYARWEHGVIRWKYWWEDVPRTLDGALGHVAGRSKAAARDARWATSAGSMLQFERYVTDVWAMRGVTWQ